MPPPKGGDPAQIGAHPGEPAADWGQTGGIGAPAHPPAGPGGTGPDLLGPAGGAAGAGNLPLDGPAGPAACQECGPGKGFGHGRQELESCSVQADQLYAKGRPFCSSCGTSRPRRKHYGPSSRTTKPSSGTTVSGWNFSGTGCGPMKPGPSGPRQTWRSSRAAGRPWRPTWPVSRPS